MAEGIRVIRVVSTIRGTCFIGEIRGIGVTRGIRVNRCIGVVRNRRINRNIRVIMDIRIIWIVGFIRSTKALPRTCPV